MADIKTNENEDLTKIQKDEMIRIIKHIIYCILLFLII